MTEIFVIAFTTFFATTGPVDVAAMFAALTPDASGQMRRMIAIGGILVATCVLVLLAVAGEPLLQMLEISLAALRVSGGILLLLIAIDMVFVRQSGGVTMTAAVQTEAVGREDISIFPLATPLIAGRARWVRPFF
jgi:multiple antibiotic resistance protein